MLWKLRVYSMCISILFFIIISYGIQEMLACLSSAKKNQKGHLTSTWFKVFKIEQHTPGCCEEQGQQSERALEERETHSHTVASTQFSTRDFPRILF